MTNGGGGDLITPHLKCGAAKPQDIIGKIDGLEGRADGVGEMA